MFTMTVIHVYFASLTLILNSPSLADLTGHKNVAFDFSDACLFGHLVYFNYQDFLSFTSDFSSQ